MKRAPRETYLALVESSHFLRWLSCLAALAESPCIRVPILRSSTHGRRNGLVRFSSTMYVSHSTSSSLSSDLREDVHNDILRD